MITLQMLRTIKLKDRLIRPDKAEIAELILDTLIKEAKAKLTETKDEDIVPVIKKLVRETEKDIELILSKGGDASKWVIKLANLKEYLPVEEPKWDTQKTEAFIIDMIAKSDGAYNEKTKGKLLGELKKINTIDMKEAAQIVNRLL